MPREGVATMSLMLRVLTLYVIAGCGLSDMVSRAMEGPEVRCLPDHGEEFLGGDNDLKAGTTGAPHPNEGIPEIDDDNISVIAVVFSVVQGFLIAALLHLVYKVYCKLLKMVQEAEANEAMRSEKESRQLQLESSPDTADFLLSLSSRTYEWEDHPDYARLRQFQVEHDLKFFCVPLLSDMLYYESDIKEFMAAGKRTKYGVLCFDPHYSMSSDPIAGHMCMRDFAFTAQNPGRTWVYLPSARKGSPWLQDELHEKIQLTLDNAYFQLSGQAPPAVQLEPQMQRLIAADERWSQLGMTRVADAAPGRAALHDSLRPLLAGPEHLQPPVQVIYTHLFPKALAPASNVMMCLQRKLPTALVVDVMHFLQAGYCVHTARPSVLVSEHRCTSQRMLTLT
jgi:hypothetical protein